MVKFFINYFLIFFTYITSENIIMYTFLFSVKASSVNCILSFEKDKFVSNNTFDNSIIYFNFLEQNWSVSVKFMFDTFDAILDYVWALSTAVLQFCGTSFGAFDVPYGCGSGINVDIPFLKAFPPVCEGYSIAGVSIPVFDLAGNSMFSIVCHNFFPLNIAAAGAADSSSGDDILDKLIEAVTTILKDILGGLLGGVLGSLVSLIIGWLISWLVAKRDVTREKAMGDMLDIGLLYNLILGFLVAFLASSWFGSIIAGVLALLVFHAISFWLTFGLAVCTFFEVSVRGWLEECRERYDKVIREEWMQEYREFNSGPPPKL